MWVLGIKDRIVNSNCSTAAQRESESVYVGGGVLCHGEILFFFILSFFFSSSLLSPPLSLSPSLPPPLDMPCEFCSGLAFRETAAFTVCVSSERRLRLQCVSPARSRRALTRGEGKGLVSFSEDA